MESNPDILNLLIADRQRRIHEDMAKANMHHPLGFARRLTGQSLISIGERIRGASRLDEIADRPVANAGLRTCLRHAR